MIEIELKLLLPDAAAARALASAAARSPLAEGAVQRRKLRSVYFDTPDRRLAQAGIALRLRRKSRAWLQTVKRRAAGRIGAGRGAGGLFSVEEDERPAPGGRLDLALVAPDLRDAVEAALGDAPLTAIFETEIQRAALILTPPSGRVELAVDAGRVVAGEAEAPLFEAEFELLSGDPAAVYEAARTLQGQGAWRFSERSKAERGHALAEGRPALPDAAARRARAIAFDPAGPTEAAAAAALLECLAQIDANMAACLAADDPLGPHPLRLGPRRLRSAPDLSREALRGPAAEALATQARDLSAVAGDLRDLDVQIDEVLRPRAAQGGADAAGFATLAAALEARRGDARARLRAALTGAQGRALLFDLSAFVALRGWLRPADHGQTAGLARPAQKTAVKALDRLWKKARRAAPEALAPDAADTPRHALREDLKKLRYAVEFLSPAFAPKAAKPFRRRLKRLQDAFGALNDGAVAERLFAGEAPPAAEDPAAQRAAGRLLGALAVQAEADREAARDGWQALVDEPRFWR